MNNLQKIEAKLLSEYRERILAACPIGKHGKPSTYALAKQIGVSVQSIDQALRTGGLESLKKLWKKIEKKENENSNTK